MPRSPVIPLSLSPKALVSLGKYLMALLLGGLLFTNTAYAYCSLGPGSSITLPNLSVASSLPVGSQIGTTVNSSYAQQVICKKGDGVGLGLQVTGTPVGTTSPNNSRYVYASNIPGIGFAVGLFSSTAGGLWNGPGPGGNRIDAQGRGMAWAGIQDMSGTYSYGYFSIAFFKTASTVGNGTLDLSNRIFSLAIDTYNPPIPPDPTWQPNRTPLQTVSGTVIGASCTVLGVSPNPVSLPGINSNQLPAMYSSGGSTPFSISISCPSSTNLYITLTDKNNIGQTGTILTPDASSTAHGVGMQLRYGGNIVGYGPDAVDIGNTNQFFLNTFSGTQSFPFTVSYIRTGPITPGNLSATATFTLSYQ